MARQVLLIGLGRFGNALARTLGEREVEVLGVDRSPERVRAAASFVTEAVCLDATDAQALAAASPATRDLCICAIGDESIEASILCTALLREMGAKRVIARASQELQARILRRVGAHEVVNPLRDFGERYASRLLHDHVLGELPLGKDLAVTELMAPAHAWGRSLAELALPRRHGLTVVALRREGTNDVELPQPEAIVQRGDILVVVSRRAAISSFMEGD